MRTGGVLYKQTAGRERSERVDYFVQQESTTRWLPESMWGSKLGQMLLFDTVRGAKRVRTNGGSLEPKTHRGRLD